MNDTKIYLNDLNSAFVEAVKRMQNDEYERDDLGLAWIAYTYLTRVLDEWGQD